MPTTNVQPHSSEYTLFKRVVRSFINKAYKAEFMHLSKDMLKYLNKYNQSNGTAFTSFFIPKRGYIKPDSLFEHTLQQGLPFRQKGVQAHVLLKDDRYDEDNLYQRLNALDDELKFIKVEYCYLSNKYGKVPYDPMLGLLPKLMIPEYFANNDSVTSYEISFMDEANYKKFFQLLQVNLVQSKLLEG